MFRLFPLSTLCTYMIENGQICYHRNECSVTRTCYRVCGPVSGISHLNYLRLWLSCLCTIPCPCALSNCFISDTNKVSEGYEKQKCVCSAFTRMQTRLAHSLPNALTGTLIIPGNKPAVPKALICRKLSSEK